jgi:predicted type IV restriction endonuclease
MAGQNEAFSLVLIDKAFEFSGWNLLDPQQMVFEHHTTNCRADYLLADCVLEIRALEARLHDSRLKLESLFQSLLHQAFAQ